ncbi:hypothetical protein ES703_65895 [subsurface metagenome]
MWIKLSSGWHIPAVWLRNLPAVIHYRSHAGCFIAGEIDLHSKPLEERKHLRELIITKWVGLGELIDSTVSEAYVNRLISDAHFTGIPEAIFVCIYKHVSFQRAEPSKCQHVIQINNTPSWGYYYYIETEKRVKVFVPSN